MSLGVPRAPRYPTVAAGVCLVVIVAALSVHIGASAQPAQAGPEQGPLMSDAVFENVQVLKGIPVDEFMDTMGMFASSLGFDCVSCHSGDIYTNRAAFAESTPLIQRARQMIVMMNTINKNYFGGQPRVSCFTCHNAKNRPEFIPNLALQYGEVMDDPTRCASSPTRGRRWSRYSTNTFRRSGDHDGLRRSAALSTVEHTKDSTPAGTISH